MANQSQCSTCAGELNDKNQCNRCGVDPDYCNCYKVEKWLQLGMMLLNADKNKILSNALNKSLVESQYSTEES
jgi:hypothetical protein